MKRRVVIFFAASLLSVNGSHIEETTFQEEHILTSSSLIASSNSCVITPVHGILDRSNPSRSIENINREISELSCYDEISGHSYFFRDSIKHEIRDLYESLKSDEQMLLKLHSSSFTRDMNYIDSLENIEMERRKRRSKDSTRSRQLDTSSQEEIRNVLIVRVSSQDASPTFGPYKLSKSIFASTKSMRSGLLDCSGGKVDLQPAQSQNIDDGVIEITVDMSTKDVLWKQVQNAAIDQLKAQDVHVADYHHTLLVLPDNTNFQDAAAYAFTDQPIAVFRDTTVQYQLVLLHELGHNLGFHHSGYQEQGYGDNTCLMGSANVPWTKYIHMCYNAAKSYYSNWYHLKIDLSPIDLGLAWNGELVGLDDYVNQRIQKDGQQVLMKVSGEGEKDLFVMFNRAKGITKHTRYPDRVTIVQQEHEFAASTLMGELKSRESYRTSNWGNTGYDLVIQDCGHKRAKDDGADYAKIRVYLSNTHENIDCRKGIRFDLDTANGDQVDLIDSEVDVSEGDDEESSSCIEKDSNRFFFKQKEDGKIHGRHCKWLRKKMIKNLEGAKEVCSRSDGNPDGYLLASEACCTTCASITSI
ncbi:hypothetical protein CTEN210_13582 [Chaetoceros tenuissimus]|uniref:Peptidase M11 gametolysin domain-containing protein n=1 Tax=Chaetoceros tenuissimus TaxID=426638 RepID=A0AAD3HBD2_9STRA|nr:hypothetical protein CTEN210_13582 [Chaetoceros tenuissimus]